MGVIWRKWDASLKAVLRLSLYILLYLLSTPQTSKLFQLPIYFFLKNQFKNKMAVQTGLDYMRSRTLVDCDTMDEESKHSSPSINF